MQDQLRAVRDFHEKHNFPCDQEVQTSCPAALDYLADTLHSISVSALKSGEVFSPADLACVRMHLITEEAAELAKALVRGDRVAAADAIGDLLYVVVGAAVSFGLPLDKIFDEIQKSNMTKAVRDPLDTRLRTKGASYVPPNIQAIVEAHDLGRLQPKHETGP